MRNLLEEFVHYLTHFGQDLTLLISYNAHLYNMSYICPI